MISREGNLRCLGTRSDGLSIYYLILSVSLTLDIKTASRCAYGYDTVVNMILDDLINHDAIIARRISVAELLLWWRSRKMRFRTMNARDTDGRNARIIVAEWGGKDLWICYLIKGLRLICKLRRAKLL